MATDFEIVGRREMPGLDATNPRAVWVVVFYRAVGDPNRAGFVTPPGAKATAAATDLAGITRAAADVGAEPAKIQARIEAHQPFMERLASEGERVLQVLIGDMMKIYTEDLQKRRGELPGGVNDVAAAMISKA